MASSCRAAVASAVVVAALQAEDVCDIAQILRGKVAIATIMDGTPVLYIGSLFAVPAMQGDINMGGMDMPMSVRWPSVRMESDYTDQLAAMCDKSVKRVVPWTWRFDLTRVADLTTARAQLGDAAYEKVRTLLGDPPAKKSA